MEFIDLKAQYAALREEINENIGKVLSSTHFILGEEEKEFEEKLKIMGGTQYA